MIRPDGWFYLKLTYSEWKDILGYMYYRICIYFAYTFMYFEVSSTISENVRNSWIQSCPLASEMDTWFESASSSNNLGPKDSRRRLPQHFPSFSLYMFEKYNFTLAWFIQKVVKRIESSTFVPEPSYHCESSPRKCPFDMCFRDASCLMALQACPAGS